MRSNGVGAAGSRAASAFSRRIFPFSAGKRAALRAASVRSRSTSVASRTPRDTASRAKAPLPVKTSAIESSFHGLSSREERMLKTASRAWSAVGRIFAERGDNSFLPR